jgi:hypothetical protein
MRSAAVGRDIGVLGEGTPPVHPGWMARGAVSNYWRRFQGAVFDDPTTRFVALDPTVLRARDLSY